MHRYVSFSLALLLSVAAYFSQSALIPQGALLPPDWFLMAFAVVAFLVSMRSVDQSWWTSFGGLKSLFHRAFGRLVLGAAILLVGIIFQPKIWSLHVVLGLFLLADIVASAIRVRRPRQLVDQNELPVTHD